MTCDEADIVDDVSTLMKPLPRVTIDGTTFLVDEEKPVALVQRSGKPDVFHTWPALEMGILAPYLRLFEGPDALWVCYSWASDGEHDDFAALNEDSGVAVVRLGIDGSMGILTLDDASIAGATAQGLWTSSRSTEELDDDYRGDELPAEWCTPTTLQVHAPGIETRSLQIDRYVVAVREESSGLVIFVNPSPPLALPDHHGGMSYHYRCTALELGHLSELPQEIRFRDFVPRGWGPELSAKRLGLEYDPWGTPTEDAIVDLSNIEDTAWKKAVLSQEQIDGAVEAIARQFRDADHYWNTENGTTVPLSNGLSQTEVNVVGSWPESTVILTFNYRYRPGVRLRRTLRVFDDSGRVQLNPYASIHLMEDLDTKDLPALSEARGGFLDI
ncbi:hypothetical protein CQ018_08245 [Arthrobacter sp. MYb227]|uniref:hypothetical protein n=1 Tax=Arthrobacter sp. MYb227 TaxID=1848601 RepID=UPI000CFAE081|nr:hypothetical protein [Arthrobacter sp. MYb227]PQZ93644.1 hypothetical protein CQ018_08245 [Arthrobacter sp. MYb227]